MTAASYAPGANLPLVCPGSARIAALMDAIARLLRADTSQRVDAPDVDIGPGAAGRGAQPSPAGKPSPERPGEVWDIVKRAQRGEPEAFGELYDRYVDIVFRYVHFRVGARSQAEDLTSETFVRALRGIGSVSWQGRDFGAWLITISRNLIADHYKSARYRLEISTADMLDADQAEDGPEDDVLDALTSATLLDTVRELNPEQQECVVLRFLQGLSVTETAQAMGKNEGAVKALQYRAVRTLGRLLPDGFVR